MILPPLTGNGAPTAESVDYAGVVVLELALHPVRQAAHPKTDMEGLKPPFLVLATHHAFMDFYVTPLCLFPHRANYVSELEGFEYYGEWPYRQVGCLGTRKFVNDLALVRNIRRCMDRGGILVLYPEAGTPMWAPAPCCPLPQPSSFTI